MANDIRALTIEGGGSSSSRRQKFLSDELYFVYNARSDNPLERVEISLPFIPETVKYNYQPNFQEQSLLGRLSPVFLYSNGSAKTYGFSINVHEDILDEVKVTKEGLPKRPDNIIELVDYIKMLSYPISKVGQPVFFPQVYFQLGELAGYGIVNVAVNWQKPYTDSRGRYVMASLSFEVTIEQPVSMPTQPETRPQEIGFESLVYDYKVSLNLTDDQARRLVKGLGPAYTGTVEDFIKENDVTDFVRNLKREAAVENFNYQVQRLQNVYKVFQDATGRGIIEDLKSFKEIGNFSYEQLVTADTSDAKEIKRIKDSFRKYLDYYYNSENTRMTRQEYFQVLDSVFLMLENLQKYAEEIYGYGASN